MHVCRLKYTTVHEIDRNHAWRSVEKIIEFQQEDEMSVCFYMLHILKIC